MFLLTVSDNPSHVILPLSLRKWLKMSACGFCPFDMGDRKEKEKKEGREKWVKEGEGKNMKEREGKKEKKEETKLKTQLPVREALNDRTPWSKTLTV